MKRLLSPALILGALLGVGLVGCSEESSVERETKIEGPDGSKTIKQTTEVETSGTPPATTTTP